MLSARGLWDLRRSRLQNSIGNGRGDGAAFTRLIERRILFVARYSHGTDHPLLDAAVLGLNDFGPEAFPRIGSCGSR